MPIAEIKQRKTTMKTSAMTVLSALIFIGTVGPISSEMLAAITLTGSSVESIDSTGRWSER